MAQRGKWFYTAGTRDERGHVKTDKQQVGLFLCMWIKKIRWERLTEGERKMNHQLMEMVEEAEECVGGSE